MNDTERLLRDLKLQSNNKPKVPPVETVKTAPESDSPKRKSGLVAKANPPSQKTPDETFETMKRETSLTSGPYATLPNDIKSLKFMLQDVDYEESDFKGMTQEQIDIIHSMENKVRDKINKKIQLLKGGKSNVKQPPSGTNNKDKKYYKRKKKVWKKKYFNVLKENSNLSKQMADITLNKRSRKKRKASKRDIAYNMVKEHNKNKPDDKISTHVEFVNSKSGKIMKGFRPVRQVYAELEKRGYKIQ
jgi:hypothetical protein